MALFRPLRDYRLYTNNQQHGPAYARKLKRLMDFRMLKKEDYPNKMTDPLAEKFVSSEHKISMIQTPIKNLDLGKYGTVILKDESKNNYAGTFKDRLALFCAQSYVEYAKNFLENRLNFFERLKPLKFYLLTNYVHATRLSRLFYKNPGANFERLAYMNIQMHKEFAGLSKTNHHAQHPFMSSIPLELLLKPIPFRMSILTSGNLGHSLCNVFEELDLPPPKLLVDKNFSKNRLEFLMRQRCDIYCADLSKKILDNEDIRILTENLGGIDMTSHFYHNSGDGKRRIYGSILEESLQQIDKAPTSVYVPYGSGMLWESIEEYIDFSLYIKSGTFKNVKKSDIQSIILRGAEPQRQDSMADKLTKPANPFEKYHHRDDDFMRSKDVGVYSNGSLDGYNKGIYTVDEDYIIKAYNMLTRNGIKTSYSGAAGLSLYLQDVDKGLIDKELIKKDIFKALIVNTGNGI